MTWLTTVKNSCAKILLICFKDPEIVADKIIEAKTELVIIHFSVSFAWSRPQKIQPFLPTETGATKNDYQDLKSWHFYEPYDWIILSL